MKYILPVAVTAFALAMALYPSSAQQPPPYPCPAGAPSCIVVTMTPDEVKSLIQPGGIFDQAIWANRSGMYDLVQAWMRKLSTAPSGEVKKDESKPPVDTTEKK
jgi:hypothetical protein